MDTHAKQIFILGLALSTSSLYAEHQNTLGNSNSGQNQNQSRYQFTPPQIPTRGASGGSGSGAAKELEKTGQEVRKNIETSTKSASDAISKSGNDMNSLFANLNKTGADDADLKEALKALTPEKPTDSSSESGSTGTDGIVTLYAEIAKTKATTAKLQADVAAAQAAQANAQEIEPRTFFDRVAETSSRNQSFIGAAQASFSGKSIPYIKGGSGYSEPNAGYFTPSTTEGTGAASSQPVEASTPQHSSGGNRGISSITGGASRAYNSPFVSPR